MKIKIACIILAMPLLVGCKSVKEATGEYITEAVKDDIVNRIDKVLEKRGLSIDEFKKVTDGNNDDKITREEVYGTVKDMTRDYVMLEAKKYVDGQLVGINANSATKGDIQSTSDKLWQYILGLVSLYLGKQLYSQRGDSKRDQKIALLEKIVHKDLDGDGIIGDVPIISTNTA